MSVILYLCKSESFEWPFYESIQSITQKMSIGALTLKYGKNVQQMFKYASACSLKVKHSLQTCIPMPEMLSLR